MKSTRDHAREQTREQARALSAHECVSEFCAQQSKHFDDYKSLVQDFGATVMRNGLVAALAFVARRGDAAATSFLDQLADFFAGQRAGTKIPGLKKTRGPGLLGAVCQLDVDDYMLATREVLHLSVWLRRAVQAQAVLDQQANQTARAAGPEER